MERPLGVAAYTHACKCALQGSLRPSVVDLFLDLGKALLGAVLGFPGSVDVDVLGTFGGFRKHGHLVVRDLCKAAGDEDMVRLAIGLVVADRKGMWLGNTPNSPSKPGAPT